MSNYNWSSYLLRVLKLSCELLNHLRCVHFSSVFLTLSWLNLAAVCILCDCSFPVLTAGGLLASLTLEVSFTFWLLCLLFPLPKTIAKFFHGHSPTFIQCSANWHLILQNYLLKVLPYQPALSIQPWGYFHVFERFLCVSYIVGAYISSLMWKFVLDYTRSDPTCSSTKPAAHSSLCGRVSIAATNTG